MHYKLKGTERKRGKRIAKNRNRTKEEEAGGVE